MQLLTTHTCSFQKFPHPSRWCLDLSVLQQTPGATLGLLPLTVLNGAPNLPISQGPQPPPRSGHHLCLPCCFCFFPTIQHDLLQQTPSHSGCGPGFWGSLTSGPGSGSQELPVEVLQGLSSHGHEAPCPSAVEGPGKHVWKLQPLLWEIWGMNEKAATRPGQKRC